MAQQRILTNLSLERCLWKTGHIVIFMRTGPFHTLLSLGLPTTYHHHKTPFFSAMKDHGRAIYA